MSSPYFVIANGAAGGGRAQGRVQQALDAAREAGIALGTIAMTEHAGHATELARGAFAAGERNFLSVGGDGTGYEVVNGLFPDAQNETVRVGMLPLGTGNSFLRDFGIQSQDDAIAALRRDQSRKIDVVQVKHQGGTLHYINLLTLGFISDAGDLTNRRFKALKDKGYLLAAMICTARLKHPVEAIRLDGETESREASSFLCFSNSQFTGGAIHVAPNAHTGDGQLDLIRARPMGKIRFLQRLLAAYEGKHVLDPNVDEERASVVEFLDPQERVVMLDGEILRLTLERLEVLPGALEVVV